MRLMKRFKSVASGFAALALFGAATAAEPLTTNTPNFRIPFAVEAANLDQAGTAILFAGRDGGKLEVLQRADAKAGGFEFNAPTDGRYAFAVRMTNAAGEVVGGTGPIQPELEVIVDTTPPTLQFQLAEATPGEVVISWTCTEAAVNPESLRLEYAEGSDGRWIPVDAVSGTTGQARITSEPGNSISVRGIITDAAGNRGSGTGQIVLASAGRNNPPYNGGTTYANNAGGTAIPANGNQQPAIPGSATAPQNAALGAIPFSTNAGPVVTSPPQRQQSVAEYRPPAATQMGAPVNNYQQPAYPKTQQPAFQPMPLGRPAYQGNYSPYSSASYGGDGPTPPSTTAGGQIVNNRVFDINYEVQDVGPSGVSTVKLFVTENNGQNWFSYGDDIDLRSPFQVDTRGEGTFGFAVRVRNGLGFSDPPPQPGELPTIVVTVDQTPPVANFAQPQVIADGQGRIQLRWSTNDAHPSPTPVRLEYAINSSGPWTPVFDWQADQGGYEMPIQPGMPNTMYYRLLTRDAAGNIATAQTPHPLMIDQHRPTVRMLSIQPVSSPRGY